MNAAPPAGGSISGVVLKEEGFPLPAQGSAAGKAVPPKEAGRALRRAVYLPRTDEPKPGRFGSLFIVSAPRLRIGKGRAPEKSASPRRSA